MTTCVLIPVYNEARTIGSLVTEVINMGMDVIVVDDNSQDGSGSIAKKRGAIVLTHVKNRGKGASLRDGFEYILDKGYQAVIIMDGDGQHSSKDIPKFIKARYDLKKEIIIGNRMGNIRNMPLMRRMTNKFMSFLISTIIGQSIPDTQCGYRLIATSVLKKIRLTTSKYETDSEVLIAAGQAGFGIGSIEIETIYQKETSQIKPLIDTLRFIKFITKIIIQKKLKIGKKDKLY
jgi:glycosyltransferase involved in cell wall biosynthesis